MHLHCAHLLSSRPLFMTAHTHTPNTKGMKKAANSGNKAFFGNAALFENTAIFGSAPTMARSTPVVNSTTSASAIFTR